MRSVCFIKLFGDTRYLTGTLVCARPPCACPHYPRAVSVRRTYVSCSAGPKQSLGPPLRCRTGFKVYVLTSWCTWVRYPAPRPSPQPLHRRAICAAKSGNSAPRTKHLENQLDLFLHGQAECQTTQGFLAHNVFLHHFIFYFRVVVFLCVLNRAERCTKEFLCYWKWLLSWAVWLQNTSVSGSLI